MTRRTISIVLSVLLLLLTLAPVAAPSALAATPPSCYHEQCNGKAPGETNCWDGAFAFSQSATPIYTNDRTKLIGYVRLWASPKCGTNWAQTYTAGGGRADFISEHVDVLNRDTYSITYDGDWYTSYSYSRMVYSPYEKARACGMIDIGYTSGSACSGYF